MLKTPAFLLAPQIESDSFAVMDLDLCMVRLAKDSRWPWLILIPKISNVEELYDLTPQDQATSMREAARVGEVFKSLTECTKINIAMIGNRVRQLHIHVVARHEEDANWPGPIWGFGMSEPYPLNAADQLIFKLRNELSD